MRLWVARWLWAVASLVPVSAADVNGSAVRPFDPGHAPAAVLVFVATDCPISNGYAPQLQRIRAAYPGVPFTLVYEGAASAAAARSHAAAYGYTWPAVVDADRALAGRVGATVTPEVAVVGGGGRLLYRGRVDDRYADFGRQRPAAATHDLQAALDAIAAGRPVPVALTKAVGCPI